MTDVPLPTEAEGWHAASADMLHLALSMMVVHAGNRISLKASALDRMTDGTLAFAFTGKDGENLDLAWVRHESPGLVIGTPQPLTWAEIERDNIKLGLGLLVIEAGGHLRIPPFPLNRIPDGELAFGTDPVTGGLLYTFIHNERI